MPFLIAMSYFFLWGNCAYYMCKTTFYLQLTLPAILYNIWYHLHCFHKDHIAHNSTIKTLHGRWDIGIVSHTMCNSTSMAMYNMRERVSNCVISQVIWTHWYFFLFFITGLRIVCLLFFSNKIWNVDYLLQIMLLKAVTMWCSMTHRTQIWATASLTRKNSWKLGKRQ